MDDEQPEIPQPAGGDSFLDVVTNVVGIMIVLVLIVGTRAGQSAAQANVAKVRAEREPAPSAAPAHTPAPDLDQEAQLTASILQTEQERQQLQRELELKNAEREQLMLTLTLAEEDLQAQRKKLDDPTQIRFDQERKLAALKAQLTRLDQQRVQILATERKVETVQHDATPLSKVVSGREIHFQLHHGRIAHVPFEDLIEKMGYLIRDQRSQLGLAELARYSNTVGPVDGFRLHFQLTPVANGGIGIGLATFLPENLDLGETLPAALADNSNFRRTLAGVNPRDTAVTLWVYPDCDKEYQRLNKFLHEQGYSVAARPLPEGMPISGSHKGTRSTAQ